MYVKTTDCSRALVVRQTDRESVEKSVIIFELFSIWFWFKCPKIQKNSRIAEVFFQKKILQRPIILEYNFEAALTGILTYLKH